MEEALTMLNEAVLASGMNNERYLKEKELLKEYEDLQAKEKVLWWHKSRETWMSKGDKNTKFFHNSTKARREINKITILWGADGSSIETS